MYDMTLTVIGNSASDHDRYIGNKRDQDLIDVACGTGQAVQQRGWGYWGKVETTEKKVMMTVKPFWCIISFQNKFILLFY